MTVFHWFSTFDESLAMLGDLCAGGFEIVPDARYDEPVAKAYDRVSSDLAAVLKAGPGFYLRGDPWTRHPLQLKRLNGGPASGSHVIDALTQGPLMQGMCARFNEVHGVPTLLMGSISQQKQYRDPLTGNWETASPEVRDAFRRAVTILRQRLVEDTLAKGFLIGPCALALVRDGRAELKTTALPGRRG